MSTLLDRNPTLLAIIDDQEREIPNGGLSMRDGLIEHVGQPDCLMEAEPDRSE